ncbi:cytochrome c-type biogenesis protein [Salinicola halophilus]|uniref:cytochrome c-type biogenesis protein n=1 Tax=Salinicola halophilus TaxID=184065 RepID=UPI000DA2170E|nr:cytochrome c-type biogenesis protein [Salinicola halophilus]
MAVKRLLGLARPMVWLLLLLLTMTAQAAIDVQSFDDPALAQRFEALSGRLRCPKCQNESIGASNSPIAGDMRARVAAMLRDGASDAEIEDAMVERFGDYALYDPRFEARTWLLWGLPFGLIVIGGGIVALFVVRRRRTGDDTLSAQERRHLDGLIARHDVRNDEPGRDGEPERAGEPGRDA